LPDTIPDFPHLPSHFQVPNVRVEPPVCPFLSQAGAKKGEHSFLSFQIFAISSLEVTVTKNCLVVHERKT
jgi:hypothetical protein